MWRAKRLRSMASNTSASHTHAQDGVVVPHGLMALVAALHGTTHGYVWELASPSSQATRLKKSSGTT
jgi:hypothetical protein